MGAWEVDLGSLQKFQIKAIKDSCKKEAYRQGHCIAKGEIIKNILKKYYDNMHTLHNDQKGNVGTTMMLAYDLGDLRRECIQMKVRGVLLSWSKYGNAKVRPTNQRI